MFHSRGYTGPADLEAIISLLLAVRPPERTTEYPGIVDVYELLNLAEVQANTRLWHQGGRLVAFAFLNPHRNLSFEVVPSAAGGELPAEILAWAEARARHMPPDDEEGPVLSSSCLEENALRHALLERLGFVRSEYTVLHMARRLAGEILRPVLPAGFRIRSVTGEEEVEALAALHRAAFGTEYMTTERRLSMMRVPEYDPTLDLLAVAPDGRLAAYCVCSISTQENTVTGRKDGHTDPVATHPEFRRLGLARALLLTGARLLQERGMGTVHLSTGSDNIAMQQAARAAGYAIDSTTLLFTRKVNSKEK